MGRSETHQVVVQGQCHPQSVSYLEWEELGSLLVSEEQWSLYESEERGSRYEIANKERERVKTRSKF